MTRNQLMDQLQQTFDYSGTLEQMTARITDEQLDHILDLMNASDLSPIMYIGLRRWALEKGTPTELTIGDQREFARILSAAETTLVLERMRRRGEVTLGWPATLSGNDTLTIAVTAKGAIRHEELKALAVKAGRARRA